MSDIIKLINKIKKKNKKLLLPNAYNCRICANYLMRVNPKNEIFICDNLPNK